MSPTARFGPNRWWVRALGRSAVAQLPGGARIEEHLRRRSGADVDAEYVAGKWRHVRAHLKAATGSRTGDLRRARVVELGTGWYPVVPLGLALHGAQVASVDTTPHLAGDQVSRTARILVDLLDDGTLDARGVDQTRLDIVREIAVFDDAGGPGSRATVEAASAAIFRLLEGLGISTHVADASDLSQVPPAHGADLLVSNNTLEHIPGPVLAAIFTEFARVAALTARMSHYIDMADHLAATDPSIGPFHFLTIGPARWRLLNNSLLYQNRLRLTDHLQLHAETGWKVGQIRRYPGDPAQLDQVRLVPPFDTMDREDLLVIRAHLVSRLAAARP